MGQATQIGVQVALIAATTALQMALQPDQPDIISEGPRLKDLQATTSNYGDPISRHFGTVRTGGTVVWAKTTEVKHVSKRETGGKGGGGQKSTDIQYEYFSSFAVILGKGTASDLLRVWADQKIVFDKTTSTAGVVKYKNARIRFYPGNLSQVQDPAIVADKGLANTPAYRDRAMVVFEDFPLADFGNRIPSMSFEVAYTTPAFAGPFILAGSSLLSKDGSPDFLGETDIINATVGGSTIVDRARNVMFLISQDGRVQRVDLATMTITASRDVAIDAYSGAAVDPRSGDLIAIFDDIDGVATARSAVRLDGRTLDTIWVRSGWGGFATGSGAYFFLPEVEYSIDPFTLLTVAGVVYGVPTGFLNSGIVLDWGAFVGYYGSSGQSSLVRLAFPGQAGSAFNLAGGATRNFQIRSIVADKNGVLWGVGDRTLGALSDTANWGILVRYEMIPGSGGTGLELRPTAFWRLAKKEKEAPADSETDNVGAFAEWSSLTPAAGIAYDPDTHTLLIASTRSSATASVNPQCRIFVTVDVAAIEGEAQIFLDDENDWDQFADAPQSDFVRLRNAKLDVWVDGPTPGGFFQDDNASTMDEGIRRSLRAGPDAGEFFLTLGEDFLGRFEWGKVSKGPTQLVGIDDFANWVKWHEGVDIQFPGTCIWMGEEEAVITRVMTASGAPPTTRWVKLYVGRKSVGDANLGDVVEAICTSTSLVASEINRTELNTKTLRGFSISGNSSARQALYQLAQAFFFDLIESGPQLKAVLRDRNKLLDIDAGRTGAIEGEPSDRQAQIVESRQPDEDLPLTVDVTYSDHTLDYQRGNQSYRRPIIPAKTQFARSPVKIQFPVVLTPSKARDIAYTTMYERYGSRGQYQTQLMQRYLELDPGDVVDVKVIREDDSVRTLPARVTQMQVGQNLLLDSGLESYDRNAYAQSHASAGGAVPGQVIDVGLHTEYFILDLPALRTKNIPIYNGANTAFSVLHALLGSAAAWKGGVLMTSDDGLDYAPLDARTQIIGWGKVTSPGLTTVSPDTDFQTFHSTSPLNVTMVVGAAQLATSTQADVLSGVKNIAVIGKEGSWEVIGFVTVSSLGGDVYQLTDLLRGQRGTNYLAEAGHGPGATFILLQQSTLISEQFNLSELSGFRRFYRADTIASRNRLGFPRPNFPLANMLRCWPVESVGLTNIDLAADLTISWVRRTFDPSEATSDPAGFGVVQLPGVDQDTVTGGVQRAYDIEILNATTGALIRLLTSTTETVNYTAANRVTDGLNATDSKFTIRIYQYTKFGSILLRGFPKSKTVQPFLLDLVEYGDDSNLKRFFMSTMA